MAKSRLRIHLFTGLGGVAVAATLWMWMARTPTPAPPIPDGLHEADALVRQSVQDTVEALTDNPRELNRWLDLARVYHANDYVQSAEACYRHILDQQVDHAHAWYGLALMYHAAGQMDRAFHALDQAIQSNGDYAPAVWRRATWALDNGRLEPAERDIQRALRIAPNSRNAVLVQARWQLAGDRAADAVGLLEPYMTKNREDPYAYQLLGRAYRQLGRTDDALIATARGERAQASLDDPWQAAIYKHKTGLIPQRKRADHLHARGEIERAIAIYENLHEDFPRNPTVATNLALAYANSGRLSRALKVLDNVRRYADSSVDQARIAFRAGDIHLRRGDVRRALRSADRAIERHPELGVAHRLRAAALFELGRRDEAMRALDQAVRYSQDDATPAFYRGQMQISLGDPSAAVESFQIAVQRNPLLLDAWLALAVRYTQLGHDDKARRALAMAQRVNPDAPELTRIQQRIETIKKTRKDSTQPDHGPDPSPYS